MYTEINLGLNSKESLLKNFLSSIGYKWSDNRRLQGLSGLEHEFDAVGVKRGSILIIIGGIEKEDENIRYRDKMMKVEKWRDESLLKFYDVQAALNAAGIMADIVFFQNLYDKLDSEVAMEILRPPFDRFRLREIGFPIDCSISVTTTDAPIQAVSSDRLRNTIQNVGACYLSLSDFDQGSLVSVTEQLNDSSIDSMKNVLRKIRVYNYFFPPADELIISCMDRGKLRPGNEDLINVFPITERLGKTVQDNVIISDINLRDPLLIAKMLAKDNMIHFESEIEITERGKTIRQKIIKSAQESLIIKILRAIKIPSILSILKG